MDIINIKFDQTDVEIGSLGMQGENNKVALHVDCSGVLEKHPDATIIINYDRRFPGESYYNLPVTALGDGIFEAVLTPMEMAYDGLKYIQIRAVEGDYEDRSRRFIGYVEKSVYDFRPPTGPVSDWLDELHDALEKAENAQQHGPVIGPNGNWHVWRDGAYVDTGVAAGSDISEEMITNAVSEYLEANPIEESDPTVPAWAKKATKPTYTAAEVGAQPAGNYLTSETDPTVPAWAKAASKPSYSYNELTDKPTIPDAYTLPVASESTLGGVKPISKTADMTQGVGVDSEGKLWALPGGGESSGGSSGGIPVVTTEGTGSAYTATIPEITELYAGLLIAVKFHTSSKASATLNVNGLGAYKIYTQVANGSSPSTEVMPQFFVDTLGTHLMIFRGSSWVLLYTTKVNVDAGGTGLKTLTSGSYLVGNGTSAVNLKTPAQVLADILPSTSADAGKVPTVQEDGTIALAEISSGGSGLTQAQIEALNGMFKVAAYTKADVSIEYAAFKAAFGIEDSDEEEPDTPVVTTYSIINELVNLTSNNSATSVEENAAYTAALTADEGYTLTGATVTVLMGGVDITATAYADGVITIAAVTGNVEIIASAVEEETEAVLPEDGLIAFFDLRNIDIDAVNTAKSVGTAYGIPTATKGSGSVYSWGAWADATDEYGTKLKRALFVGPENTASTIDLGTEYTFIGFSYGGYAASNHGSVGNYWPVNPKYIKTDASSAQVGASTITNAVNTGYLVATTRVSGAELAFYTDTTKVASYNGEDYEGFSKWASEGSFTITPYTASGVITAAAFYNRALTDVEIAEAVAFLNTLEVTA